MNALFTKACALAIWLMVVTIVDAATIGEVSDERGIDDNIPRSNKHEIHKRSPVPPLAPLMYKSCATGTIVGTKLVKIIYPTFFGPLGKALTPIMPPALAKIFLTKLCPKVALAG